MQPLEDFEKTKSYKCRMSKTKMFTRQNKTNIQKQSKHKNKKIKKKKKTFSNTSLTKTKQMVQKNIQKRGCLKTSKKSCPKKW